MPRDAGGEIELFSNASLAQLESLFAAEEILHKKAITAASAYERDKILEEGELRKDIIDQTTEYRTKKLKDIAQMQINIETKVNEQLIAMGKMTSTKDLEDRKNAKKAELQIALDNQAKLKAAELKDKGGKKSKEYKEWLAEQKKQIKKALELHEQELKDKYEKDQKYAEKVRKTERAKASKEYTNKFNEEVKTGVFGKGLSLAERRENWSRLTSGEDGKTDPRKAMVALTSAISDFAKQLENKIDEIGGRKGAIDTRLQGSKNKTTLGSYWDHMSWQITGIAGVSPFIKQETIVTNLDSLVKKGIAYNVEQRALLQTVSEKIANTFNVADGTLLRLIRIQQQDSTAARLGMESALNAFLNNMYETSEYLSDLAANVRGSLEEAQALMETAQATELEWQVQKWLGSMYSVGMSSKGVQGIADALGKLIAGDISGITSGGTGNLVIMAANQANLSIADILARGLDASDTNRLMKQMVNYLSEIYENSKDSRVVQQQLANVYGLTASDLKAIKNLSTTDNTIIGNKNLNYNDMTARLYSMANTMVLRTGVGEMLTNVWNNFQYTMAAGIANNPILYTIYKAAGLLDNAVGGIAIPMVSVMGTTVDLHTTVADLMRVAAMSGGILQGLGAMITNLGAAGGFSGAGMLKALGIGTTNSVQRGGGNVITDGSGLTTSEYGYVGNADSSAVKDKTMQDANEDANNQLVEAQESGDQDIERKVLNESIVQIYDLLLDVINGTSAFTVQQKSGTVWSTSNSAGGTPGVGGF